MEREGELIHPIYTNTHIKASRQLNMDSIYYDIKKPRYNDVLGGRGNGANAHPGNIDYRKLVAIEYDRYIAGSNEEKRIIALQIIDKVKSANPPGRFLKRDKSTGLWNCMHDENTLKKVCQRLREYQPSQLKHQLLVLNINDISTTPPSCSVSMNINRSKPPLRTETSQNIPSLMLNSPLSSTFSSLGGIVNKHNNASDLTNDATIASPQQPLVPPSLPTPTPIYKECNIDTNGCEVKDRLEILMVKSVDDLKADIKAEEGKMAEVERIRVELEKLQKTYTERKAALNPTDLFHMKAIMKKEQSTTTIYSNNCENIESRKDRFKDIKDESMRSLSEGNLKTINSDYVQSMGSLSKSGSSIDTIDAIELNSTLSLKTLGAAEIHYIRENVESSTDRFQNMKDESMKSLSEGSIETINFDYILSRGILNKSSSSIDTIELYTNLSLKNLETAEIDSTRSQDSISLMNLDFIESWRTFSMGV